MKITPQQFRVLADAAVSAVGWTEGWCDVHPSWHLDAEGNVVSATPTFRRFFREQLRKQGVIVTRETKPDCRLVAIMAAERTQSDG